MKAIFGSKIGRVLIVILLYALHFVAVYSATTFFNHKNLLLYIISIVSILCLFLSVIIGWLIAADDFREAFLRFKKLETAKIPPSEFTIFAPVRFGLAIIMWPYLALFFTNEED
jgi:hypothetical protein